MLSLFSLPTTNCQTTWVGGQQHVDLSDGIGVKLNGNYGWHITEQWNIHLGQSVIIKSHLVIYTLYAWCRCLGNDVDN
jgi:hypothetical protein